MIIWGGWASGNDYFNSGGRYNPNTDSWISTSTINAPYGRSYHTAVWTGTEMIIWGGYSAGAFSNAGAKYNPTADAWTIISTTNAPSARFYHTAIWTGTEMIIWGGRNDNLSWYGLNTGGRYNPEIDSWRATTTANSPTGSYEHTAIWTGTEMIVWGGCESNWLPDYDPDPCHTYINTGGKYIPSLDTWSLSAMNYAPLGRKNHTAVWTGEEMIIWGGRVPYYNFLNTGGKYYRSQEWSETLASSAPEARYYHSAAWTGVEMIIWGGANGDSPNSSGLNTGGRYNPGLDSWMPTSVIDAPEPRIWHTAIWTGTEMIIWGGFDWKGNSTFSTGGRYNPTTDTWIDTSTTNAAQARSNHTVIWTGTKMIVWGGESSPESWGVINTGGRYDPETNIWASTTTANAPEARSWHTSIWTGTEMIVWGGADGGGPWNSYFNTGGRYNPNTDSWISTSTIIAPDPRRNHTAIWTGMEMIIWGGWSVNGIFNTGGRYDPITNSWKQIASINAPDARFYHTAVWTGTEMIVWGGCETDPVYCDSGAASTGARYDLNDFWTATTTFDAPYPRFYHTAVWTGTDMIIWGGQFDWYGPHYNTGSRYCANNSFYLVSQKPVIDDSGSSTPNGIIETDETVNLIGSLTNLGSNTAASISAVISTSDPIILNNSNAVYPDISPADTQSCTTCYSITAPAANRPATHWDVAISESSSCIGCLPVSFGFVYHIGSSFNDVSPSNLFYSYVEKLLHNGITSGCGARAYCPTALVQRQQMAKFICASMQAVTNGSCTVSSCLGIFADVPASNPFCGFIEGLYNAGVVSGCQSTPQLLYCPGANTQRQAMAKFICKGMNGAIPDSCIITGCTGIFTDVPSSNPFCGYIEGLKNAGVISGCTASTYCPYNNVPREQMAKFLVNAFGFSL